MDLKRIKIGMSHSTWIIVTLVVVLIIALILITISGGSLRKGGTQSDDSITKSGGGLNAQVCSSLCESCLKKSSTDPATCDDWATYGGTCSTVVPPATTPTLENCQ